MDTTNTPSGTGARVRRLAAGGVAIVLALALAACGDDDDDTASDSGAQTGTDTGLGSDTTEGGAADTTGAPGSGADATLEVTSLSYSDLSVPAGGTVEIVNTSGAPHTLTADDGSFEVEFGSDETTSLEAPSEPGEYPFHCEIHPSMTATLTVE